MKRNCYIFQILLICLTVIAMSGCKLSNEIYYLPYEEGFTSYIAQGNDGLLSHFWMGKHAIDFIMPNNTKVVAARCGKVVEVVLHNPNINCITCRNNYIMIEHIDGTRAKYVHLNRDTNPKVQVGQYVERGHFIAFSGNSGNSWTPHLHFEVWGPDENGDITESLKVYFADVNGDGIPRAYMFYTSKNKAGVTSCYPLEN